MSYRRIDQESYAKRRVPRKSAKDGQSKPPHQNRLLVANQFRFSQVLSITENSTPTSRMNKNGSIARKASQRNAKDYCLFNLCSESVKVQVSFWKPMFTNNILISAPDQELACGALPPRTIAFVVRFVTGSFGHEAGPSLLRKHIWNQTHTASRKRCLF
jgi:hypothetical protein